MVDSAEGSSPDILFSSILYLLVIKLAETKATRGLRSTHCCHWTIMYTISTKRLFTVCGNIQSCEYSFGFMYNIFKSSHNGFLFVRNLNLNIQHSFLPRRSWLSNLRHEDPYTLLGVFHPLLSLFTTRFLQLTADYFVAKNGHAQFKHHFLRRNQRCLILRRMVFYYKPRFEAIM